jgi:hypothetical protein
MSTMKSIIPGVQYIGNKGMLNAKVPVSEA